MAEKIFDIVFNWKSYFLAKNPKNWDIDPNTAIFYQMG